MTADWARIPYDTVATVSTRIVNEVPHVNRVDEAPGQRGIRVNSIIVIESPGVLSGHACQI